jgi:hypothetical protein
LRTIFTLTKQRDCEVESHEMKEKD